MGRHMGHTFVYLQDAVQDCRAITIQLLADAQQGRQAVQVRRLGAGKPSADEIVWPFFSPLQLLSFPLQYVALLHDLFLLMCKNEAD